MRATRVQSRSLIPVKPKKPHQLASSDPLPPELRSLANKINQSFQRQRKEYLHNYYDIGVDVAEELARREKRHGSTYGLKVIDILAKAAEVDARTLGYCIRLHQMWPLDQFSALAARPGITWTHVTHLLGIDDQEFRDALVDRVEREGLSSDGLDRAISEKYGNRRPGTGRPHSTPRNAPLAISRLLSMSAKFTNTIGKALFGIKYDIPTELEKLPPDSVTPQLRDQVQEGVAALRAAGQAAFDSATSLDRGVLRLDTVLAERQRRETMETTKGDTQEG